MSYPVGLLHSRVAKQILRNQTVLDYMQSTPHGLEKAAYILSNFENSFHTGDVVIDKIMELAAIKSEDSLYL